jgi:hypothetical protein
MIVEKISRSICLVKYRKLPLREYEKESDEYIDYYPKVKSVYWLKLEDDSEKNVSKEITNLVKKLGIENLIFLGEMDKPWISKSTASRIDYKPLVETIEYFKSNKIEKKFNGGVKVGIEELKKFIFYFYTITKCDGGFFDFNFIDENQNLVFYIHYSGEIQIFTLNENSNKHFLNIVADTKFIDSMRENTNRIS